MIELHGIHKYYAGGTCALQGVTLALAPGEMVFLTGHSGAGKSTLLKMISLIERPSKGQILFDRTNLTTLSNRRIPFYRRQLGMVFQNNLLLSEHSVFDNVALPLKIMGFTATEIRKRTHTALDLVGLLAHEKKLPRALSSGEQQRVGIARAVVAKPKVLLADEPTGNLDPALSWEIMQLFDNLHQVGVTVLIATHDIELVKRFNYRQLVLDQGQLLDNDE